MSSPPATQQAPGKAAMSRALGAAFLSHQVAQLERAVANSNSNPRDSNAPRRGGGQRGRGRGAGPAPGAGGAGGPKRAPHRAQTNDDDYRSMQLPSGLSAVVLDASVLIYAPGAVKRWCKDDNGPDLVVPLEVLNTLDLLKKGTTLLAQRARAASRLLESFVGSDTRLRVQRDEAFVPWADVPLHSNSPDSDHDSEDVLPPPEWLRRTLCCARWEVQPASDPLARPRAVVVAVADPSPADTPTEPAANSPGRHDARADGLLVKSWVPRVAGLRLHSVKPCNTGTAKFTDKAAATIETFAPAGPDTVPIVAPTTVPRARGKQLFDPKSDDAYNYADPLHPDSPRFSRQSAARKAANQPVPPPPVAIQSRKRDEPQPMRVVRLLARGEKLDP